LEEQHLIVENLDLETKQIRLLLENINQAIESLQEYRTSLVSAAVTGKIDVRN